MPGTEDDWIIEVVPGDADRAVTSGQTRPATVGLVIVLAATGALTVLGFLAFRALTSLLSLLPGVAGAIALTTFFDDLRVIAVTLVLVGRRLYEACWGS